MVMPPTERSELVALSRLNRDLYAQVDAYYDHLYLPRLLLEDITRDLPRFIRDFRMLPESDGQNHVLHIGSIKLFLYSKNTFGGGRDLFAIQLMTASVPGGTGDCIALQFDHNPCGNMHVEFTTATKYRGPDRFRLEIPETAQCLLNSMLAQLHFIVGRVFSRGFPEERDLRPLIHWATPYTGKRS